MHLAPLCCIGNGYVSHGCDPNRKRNSQHGYLLVGTFT
jgi:hypothetical protein